jgi:hypothetical protein
MMPGTMTVHAFVDESRRGCVYLVAAAIAEPANLRLLRRELRGLLMPGQRELHFKREKEPRQRELAAAMCRLPIGVHTYTRSCHRREEPARQACVDRLAHDLLGRGAHRLVIDSRSELDIEDARTIRRALGRGPARPTSSTSTLIRPASHSCGWRTPPLGVSTPVVAGASESNQSSPW